MRSNRFDQPPRAARTVTSCPAALFPRPARGWLGEGVPAYTFQAPAARCALPVACMQTAVSRPKSLARTEHAARRASGSALRRCTQSACVQLASGCPVSLQIPVRQRPSRRVSYVPRHTWSQIRGAGRTGATGVLCSPGRAVHFHRPRTACGLGPAACERRARASAAQRGESGSVRVRDAAGQRRYRP